MPGLSREALWLAGHTAGAAVPTSQVLEDLGRCPALQISAQGVELLSFSPHGEVSVSTPCWYSKGQKVYKAVSLEMLGTDHDSEYVQVGELGRLASEGHINGY